MSTTLRPLLATGPDWFEINYEGPNQTIVLKVKVDFHTRELTEYDRRMIAYDITKRIVGDR